MAKRTNPTDVKTQSRGLCDDIRDEAGKLYKYTPKEKLFVNAYLTKHFMNGTASARAAGYNCKKDATFRQLAVNIMRKPHIRAAIGEAFEALTMSKYEMLYRLGRIGAGDLADVLDDDDKFSIAAARERGTTHLLKKVHVKRTVREVTKQSIEGSGNDAEVFETSLIDEEIKFEIHDPIRALELIGKANRVFVERVEAAGPGGKSLIPENAASVVVYLPDNGRGDSDADVAKAKAARTKGQTRNTP